jgi:hypothetical protein
MHFLFYPVSLFCLLAFFVIKDVPSANSGAAILMAIVSFILGLISQGIHQSTEKREAGLKQALWDVSRELEERNSTAGPAKTLPACTELPKSFSLVDEALIYGSTTIPSHHLSIEIRDGVEGLRISSEYCQLVGQTWVSKREIKGDFNRLYHTSAADNLWIAESPKAERDTVVNRDVEITAAPKKTAKKESIKKDSIRTVKCVNCGYSANKPFYLASTLGKDFIKCPNCAMNFELSRQKH